jgi:hypothetical protein
MAAFEQGQRLRRQGSLLESRAQLLLCARDPCPPLLRPDCLRWLHELDPLIPSVVVSVRRDDGTDITNARLFIDGRLQTERLDGSAIEVNPGEHAVRVEVESSVLEQIALTHVAEKGHVVSFRIGAPAVVVLPPPPPPPLPSRRPIAWPTFALAGLSVTAMGLFAGFAVDAESRYAGLESCRPACDPAAVDATRRSYRVANVALVVSVVALTAAIVTFVVRPTLRVSTVAR